MMKNFYIPVLVLLVVLSGCTVNSGTGIDNERRGYNNHILSFDMDPVGGGTIFMGSNDTTAYAGANPEHSVSLDSFFIQQEEVRYGEYEGIRIQAYRFGYTDLGRGENGATPDDMNYAVTMVSWYDCVKWCNAWSQFSGLEPVYYTDSTFKTIYQTGMIGPASLFVKWTATGYRLPTEAEWEFAARGGMKTHYYTYSGSDVIDKVARYAQNPGLTQNVRAGGTPNELGLYDMSGNVWEWCWDWYGPYGRAPQTHPKGPLNGTLRVMRGGCFSSPSSECRVASRHAEAPAYRSASVGFRVVQRGCVY